MKRLFRKKETGPSEDSIIAQCERLAELEGQYVEKTAEIQAAIEALMARANAEAGDLKDEIAHLEKAIKQDCLVLGHTVNAPGYQVIYVDGRVTWNKDGLEGYAIDHPGLLEFRKVGKPSARLKKREGE